MTKNPKELISLASFYSEIYIQTHDFPDQDAVASAFGLFYILKQFNIKSKIVYAGEILRDSIHRMISEFNISIFRADAVEIMPNQRIVVIDGSRGNSNVSNLGGIQLGVIDHHSVARPEIVDYSDIRPNFGACSTIIASYFFELGIKIPRNVASALMIGINIDTLHLTRSVSPKDVAVYAQLYSMSDNNLVNSIIRNDLSVKDMESYRYLLDNVEIEDSFAFVFFPQNCSKNLIAILSAFLITFEEIDFAVVCAENNGKIDISVKSEKKELDAALIVSEALHGIGKGGGHTDMAGGIVIKTENLTPNEIKKRFQKIIEVYSVNLNSQVSSFGKNGESAALKITE